MEHSPSPEAEGSSVSQQILGILLNPKDLYRIHNNPQLAPIPNQINPVHAFPSYFLKMQFNIILPRDA